ncbi:MAG: hypothetical protein ACI8VT_004545 [Saprospiraceae bacterium]
MMKCKKRRINIGFYLAISKLSVYLIITKFKFKHQAQVQI